MPTFHAVLTEARAACAMTSSRSVTASPAPSDACAAEDGGGGGGAVAGSALWSGSCGAGEDCEEEEAVEEAEGSVSEEAMSGLGFGDAATLNGHDGSGEALDKIDMSLDDIIRLNRAEARRLNGGFYRYMNGRFRPSGSRWGFQQQKGFRRGRFGYRWRGVSGRRRPYRVKTGLAAWKASNFREGVSPLSRSSLTERRSMYSRSLSPPRSPEWRKPVPSLQWPLERRDNASSSIAYNGYDYNYDEEREPRQTSFLSRRGLKVHTQLETDLHIEPSDTRPPPWRTSTTSGGILTVSIENPTALELTVNPASRLPRSILPPFLIKDPSEQKAPKGVALQFDINSIAKQTGITLNERFRILKEQRFTLSPSKGTRFVTVG